MFEEPEYVEAGFILSRIRNLDYKPADTLLDEPITVGFVVGYQAGGEIPPDIARVTEERLKEATGKEVEVTVGFVVLSRPPDKLHGVTFPPEIFFFPAP